MKTDLKANLKTLERKISGQWQHFMNRGTIPVSDEEAKYLMSGYSTELIESPWLLYNSDSRAKIYGVVAANKQFGRYAWIYLHYSCRLWKCHSLEYAYEILERLKHFLALQKEQEELEKKIRASEKLLRVCPN